MDVTCYEITHDGEGERGENVEVWGVKSPDEAAREASTYFDDEHDRRERIHDENHHDGGSRVIEVEWPGGLPQRFRVRCKVVREYHAEPEPPR